MNESYETYATRAESGEPATLGRLSLPVAQSAEHRPIRAIRLKSSGIKNTPPEWAAGTLGIKRQFSTSTITLGR
jgi:hypothetical protein